MIKSYINKKGTPLIRKCGNCLNYKVIEGKDKVGYCRLRQLLFAFTHEESVYAIVKDFYLCETHEFINEEMLKKESQEVELLPFLLDRNAKKKQ
jgi:hypothetical protein